MHEMRGDIPAECGLLMAGTFISDHIAVTAPDAQLQRLVYRG